MASVMLDRPLLELGPDGLIAEGAVVDSTGALYELPSETDGVVGTMLMLLSIVDPGMTLTEILSEASADFEVTLGASGMVGRARVEGMRDVVVLGTTGPGPRGRDETIAVAEVMPTGVDGATAGTEVVEQIVVVVLTTVVVVDKMMAVDGQFTASVAHLVTVKVEVTRTTDSMEGAPS